MKPARYVILDPSGNLTALVTEWGGRQDEAEITERLMGVSEQVAYLEPPVLPGSIAGIRLMGGEFCGNAAMASAGWLVRDLLSPGKEMTVPIEVSGAEGVLFCRIKGLEDGFEGTVEMPRVLEIKQMELSGACLTAVRMEGILHLIRENATPFGKEEAESLLKKAAAGVEDEAVGLMDLDTENGIMRPLVYVRGSSTMVWETACGSGSAAVGAVMAVRKGNGTTATPVSQPGGIIIAEAEAKDGRIIRSSITGKVHIREEAVLF